MKPINISSLIKKYGPGYIAKNRRTGKVIAHAARIDLLFKKPEKDPILAFPGFQKVMLNMSFIKQERYF